MVVSSGSKVDGGVGGGAFFRIGAEEVSHSEFGVGVRDV